MTTPHRSSPLSPDAAAPLSAAQLQLLASARAHRSSVRTAAGLAAFNGASLLFASFCYFAAAAFGQASLGIGIVLLGFGAVELRGRGQLRAFEPAGATLLMGNQLALLGIVWIYCAVGAYRGLSADPAIAESLGQYRELYEVMRLDRGGNLDGGVDWVTSMYRRVIAIFYGGVALMALIFQGGCAYYYRGRQEPLRALAATPPWVRELTASD